jgi:uncharacterized protein YjbI with pentapeptide repeats
MKVVKPSGVSFSSRTIQLRGEHRLSVTSLIGFALQEGAPKLVGEQALWIAIGETVEGIVDEGLPKSRGEVLVHGSCHTPGGKALAATYVRVKLGTIDKKLAVIGDRQWLSDPRKGPFSDPIPFTTMPLGWARAQSKEAPPNIEHFGRLMTSRSQRHEPANLGPMDVSFVQRRALAGTYDQRWLENDFPGYARDTDPAFFQTAPADQRIDGFFRGDEEYALENMHPTRTVMRGVLPRVAARTFLRGRGRTFEEVKTRLETVVFLPERELGILVFRGATRVEEDDAADVGFALAAAEDVESPREAEHYLHAFERRLDKDQSPLLALKEDDLSPSCAPAPITFSLPKNDRGAAKRAEVLAEVRRELEKHDVDPAVLEGADEPPPELADIAARATPPEDPEQTAAFLAGLEQVADDAAAYADGSAKQQLEDARADAKKHGVEIPDAPAHAGPPTPDAPAILASLAEAGRPADRDTEAKLHRADALALEAYRFAVHFMPAAPSMHDFSGCDLREADYQGQFLESAILTGTDLSHANLSETVLAHARLENTVLTGANLVKVNLGGAFIDGASFDGADLKEATFTRAKLVRASFKDALLTEVDWMLAELGALDFEGAHLASTTFLAGADVSRCRFPRAKLKKASFLESVLDGVDFSGADCELVTFVKVSAAGADFRGASLRKLHAVMGCNFAGANFEGANLEGAYLRGADLRGADLRGARLGGADLSEADLSGAKLSGVQAREAMFVRAELAGADVRAADLMSAMFQKASLRGADLSGASLFGANLGLIRVDTATKLAGATLKRSVVLPKRRKEA